MQAALEALGSNETYHGRPAIDNPLEAGKLDGREEWDQLLGHCQAVTTRRVYFDRSCSPNIRSDPAKWWKSSTMEAREIKAHCEQRRRIVPKENLLKYEVGEGWDRLCAFLGHEVPDSDFPSLKDIKAFRQVVMSLAWLGLQAMALAWLHRALASNIRSQSQSPEKGLGLAWLWLKPWLVGENFQMLPCRVRDQVTSPLTPNGCTGH
ncbi:hypothetical protein FB451DRAFT_1509037 [Mycena latifolia]|nr:hypothetical protein FB451DRAFT_1509037 [Mycena latifolia]